MTIDAPELAADIELIYVEWFGELEDSTVQ